MDLIELINSANPEKVELLAGIIWKLVFTDKGPPKEISKEEFIAEAKIFNQKKIHIDRDLMTVTVN